MTEDAQMKIRLPRELKERIETAATAANRSWNGEIVSRLEWSFAGGDMVLNRDPTPAGKIEKLEADLAELRAEFDKFRKQFSGGDASASKGARFAELRAKLPPKQRP